MTSLVDYSIWNYFSYYLIWMSVCLLYLHCITKASFCKSYDLNNSNWELFLKLYPLVSRVNIEAIFFISIDCCYTGEIRNYSIANLSFFHHDNFSFIFCFILVLMFIFRLFYVEFYKRHLTMTIDIFVIVSVLFKIPFIV